MLHTDCGGISLATCPLYRKKSTRDRRLLAQKLRVCFVCLLKNQNSSNCRNKVKCRHCSSLHHELLCPSVRAQDAAFLVDQDNDSAVDEQQDEVQDILTDHEHQEHDGNIPESEDEHLDYSDDILDNNEFEYEYTSTPDDSEISFLDEDIDESNFDAECWLFHADCPDSNDHNLNHHEEHKPQLSNYSFYDDSEAFFSDSDDDYMNSYSDSDSNSDSESDSDADLKTFICLDKSTLTLTILKKRLH